MTQTQDKEPALISVESNEKGCDTLLLNEGELVPKLSENDEKHMNLTFGIWIM